MATSTVTSKAQIINEKDTQENGTQIQKTAKRTGRRKSQLDKNEVHQLKQAFKFFDKNDDGTITTEEINVVMESIGLQISKQELEDIMADLDVNGDGHMDFDEFVQMMDRRMSVHSQRAEIEDTFKFFDKNGDGKITFEELKEVLLTLGEEVSDKDVWDMIKEADTNGDNAIDFEEFITMMVSNEDEGTKSLLFKEK